MSKLKYLVRCRERHHGQKTFVDGGSLSDSSEEEVPMGVRERAEVGQNFASKDVLSISKSQILRDFFTSSHGNLVDSLSRNIPELKDHQVSVGFYRAYVACEFPTIKYILCDQHHMFTKIPLEKKVLGAAMGDGLIVAEGERWKRQHEAMRPLFTGKNLTKFNEVAAQVLEEQVQKIGFREINVNELTLSWTMEIILRYFLCDIPVGRLPGELTSLEYARKFLKAEGQLESTIVSNLPWKLSALFGGRKRTLEREGGELDAILEMVRQRLKLCWEFPELWTLQEKNLGTQVRDFTEAEDEVSTLLVASATTAHQLSFTLWLLGRDFQLQKDLSESLEGVDGKSPKQLILPYAVIQETLRLYPPAPLMMRRPVPELGTGFDMFIIPIWRLNREPTIFPSPEEFNPERWVEKKKSGERLKHFREFIPFGMGPRVCPGRQMSTIIGIESLKKISETFRLKSVTPAPRVKTEILTRSKNDLKVKFVAQGV